ASRTRGTAGGAACGRVIGVPTGSLSFGTAPVEVAGGLELLAQSGVEGRGAGGRGQRARDAFGVPAPRPDGRGQRAGDVGPPRRGVGPLFRIGAQVEEPRSSRPLDELPSA